MMLLSNSRKPTEQMRTLAIQHMNALDRPVLIGELAMKLGISVERAEQMLESFVSEELVIELPHERVVALGHDHRVRAFSLVSAARPSRAGY